MKIKRLIQADIYRDGGSIDAQFEADNGVLSLYLPISGNIENRIIHKGLFECLKSELNNSSKEVFTGTDREQEIIKAIRDYLTIKLNEEEMDSVEKGSWDKLDLEYNIKNLVLLYYYIPRRVPKFKK